MFRVIACITQQHDIRLVLLAGVLCMFACFTAASMVLRGRAVDGRARWVWLVAAGIVFGCGIWATHFIAMLAYEPGFPVNYDAELTLLSVVVAVVFSTGGFALALNRIGPLMGGAIAGSSIGAMHYIGMAAVRAPARADWSAVYVIASVLVGVGLTALAMRIALRKGDIRSLLMGGGLLGTAIVVMHFTGMAAVVFVPDPTITVPHIFMDPASLAIAVAAVGILIVTLGLTGAVVDYHLARRATGEAERLRSHIAELERTKRELEKTSEDLTSALGAAAAANESKANFLASMSHELRTPLNAIIGFSDFLMLEAFGPIGCTRYREYIQDIHDSGAHLLSLINDVLDLSRLDAGQTELKEEDIDLSGLVAETLRMLQPQAQKTNVTLLEGVDDNVPFICADRRRILQVLLNLVSNAVKFTPAGGTVTIAASYSGTEVRIAVRDTGIGIAKHDIPRALERFGQVDSRLARKYQGAGLGLPLAKQLMELHGGRLELTSEVGRGTTVTVTLPAERVVSANRQVA